MADNQIAVQQATTPATLLQTAIEKGVEMQQLKELMDLQERWEKKEARKQFFDALSKFQTLVPALKKNKTANVPTKSGGQFSYKYADLGSIAAGIKDALNQCGLSYRWEFKESKDGMQVTCLVSHSAGHTETTSMEAGKDMTGAKNDIQSKGSTQTYLQRYTLIGALGLSTADDDNDGSGNNKQPFRNASTAATSKGQTEGQNDEEYIEQWKDKVAQIKTYEELNDLYMREHKKVSVDPKIKAVFTAHKLKLTAGNSTKSSPVTKMP